MSRSHLSIPLVASIATVITDAVWLEHEANDSLLTLPRPFFSNLIKSIRLKSMFMMLYCAFVMAGLPHHYSQPSAAPEGVMHEGRGCNCRILRISF